MRKGVLRHYHYRSDQKSGPGIFAIRRIPCSCHDCTTILSLPGILQSNKYLIGQDNVGYIIANSI